MHRAFFIAAFWLSCASSHAQSNAGRQPTMDDPMLASYCEPGKGCHSCVLPYSHAATAIATSLNDVQPGDILVVSPVGREWQTSTRRGVSTWQLGIQFGGQGRDLLKRCEERPALPGAIQPMDGRWMVSNANRTFDGCPAVLEENMRAAEAQPMAIEFPRPFLGELEGSSPAMVQTGPNSFRSFLAGDHAKEFTTLLVTSPNRIWIAKMTSLTHPDSTDTCIVSTTAELLRLAD